MRVWAAGGVLCLALLVAVVVGLSTGSTRHAPARHASVGHASARHAYVSGHASVAGPRRRGARRSRVATAIDNLPSAPAPLAAAIDSAQTTIDDTAATEPQLASASLTEQLATVRLDGMTAAARRATLARLDRPAAATLRANLQAAAALSGLTPPRRHLPPWRIIAPPPAPTLLRYFRAAQARYGVGWEYLAAIEFIETRFGRVAGRSSAGAQGPMQFEPSTWAQYGNGSIDDPRAAVMAAARFLIAAGARANLAAALYHYNNSLGYVHAVEDYARRMRADPRAYVGYYHWQVLYAYTRGTVILPVGYPAARPIPVG